MTITTGTAPTGGANLYSATTTPTKTTGKSTLDSTDFLTLLVAQLRYQDPLDPAKGAEFVAQTAQLTSVETLKDLAGTTEQAFALQQRWSSAALVGRQVTYATADGTTVSGTVTSVAFSGTDPVLRVRTGDGAAATTSDVALSALSEVSTEIRTA